MSSSAHQRDSRVALSLLALSMWVLGVVLGPVLHSLGHDLQHAHTPTGLVRMTPDDDLAAREAALTALVRKLRAPRGQDTTAHVQSAPKLHHGHGVFEHFGVTWTQARVFLFVPPARRVACLPQTGRKEPEPALRKRWGAYRSRGPPAKVTPYGVAA